MSLSSRSLIVPQRLTQLLLSYRLTLRFWCLTPKGRGIEYVRSRGSDTSRGSIWFISFSPLCVIHYYAFMFTFMHWTTYVWSWYLCDSDINVIFMWYVTCVPSTLIFIYVMSLGYAHLPCFHVLLWFKWALLHVLMLNSYLLSTPCWLGSYKHA